MFAFGSSEERLAVSSPLTTGQTDARWIGDVLRMRDRRRTKTSARVIDDGDDAGVAVRSSTIFAMICGMFGVKASSGLARMRSEVRRNVVCALRSASCRADAAPTPNMIPAVVGAVSRDSSSGTRSLSDCVHCERMGSHASRIRSTGVLKNFGSLKAS